MVDYSVEVEYQGPAAWIHYREPGVHLRFWREYLVDGASVSVPTVGDWDVVCLREGAPNAVGRRQEIIDRVVEDIRRRVPTLLVEFRDDWIHLRF